MNEDIPDINKICVKTEGVAGAGKTTDAIKSIQEHTETSKTKGILMFSLTRATIQNLLNRMKYSAPCYTVHSFCLRLLKAQAALEHTQAPKILDGDQANRYLMEAIVANCPKDDPEEVKKGIMEMRTRGKSRKDYPEHYGIAMDKYLQRLESLNSTDFPGIIEKAYLRLHEPEIYQRYDGLYVMCDESQDFNPNFDWRIVDIIRRRSEQFWLYSSPSQEIYSFAGANYKKLCESLPDYTQTRILNKSHRCVPEIVEVAKHLGGHDARLMESCLDPSGYPTTWYELENHSLSLRMLVSTILAIKESNPSLTLEDFAILGRQKRELANIANQLKDYSSFGIRTRMVGSDPNIYKSISVCRFIDYLSIALNGGENVLDNILNYPNFGIREEEMVPVRGFRRLCWKDLEKVASDPASYTYKVYQRARFLLNYRENAKEIMQSGMSDEEKIHKLCFASGIQKCLTDQLMFDDSKKIDKICEDIAFHRDLKSYYDYMAEQSQKDDAEVGGINLCNYHSSKGREWNTVFLLESGDSTRNLTDETQVQALNTAYVASTRAMERLYIATESDRGYPDYLNFMRADRKMWYG